MTETPARLRALPPAARSAPRLDLRIAAGRRARLVGLAFLPGLPPDCGLLLTGTRSVHTVGMRFALDLVWLDRAGVVVRVDEGVGPWRVRTCVCARAVVELAGGAATRHGLKVGAGALAR